MRAMKAVVRLLLVFVIIFLFCTSTYATLQFTQVGYWGGSCTSAAVSDNRAYVGMGYYLNVFDITNPVNPAQLGVVKLNSYSITDIVVSGSYVYAALAGSGMQIIDVSDPYHPSVIGSFTIGDTQDLAVSNGYAYLADRGFGLRVVDISDPSQPTLAGSCDVYGTTNCVGVSGNYVFLGQSSALQVIDVSNPTTPTKVGTYSSVNVTDLQISGNRLYAVCGTTDGFQIFDITTPTYPYRLFIVDTPGDAQGIAVSGNYAFIADSTYGLQIINTVSANPYIIGAIDTDDKAQNVVVKGNYAYIADSYDGLQVINISSLGSPTKAGAYESGCVNGIAISGNIAYVACSQSSQATKHAFIALNISNPSSIKKIGGCSISGSGAIVLDGDYAYVAGHSAGLQIVKVTNPTVPVKVGGYDTYGTACDVVVSQPYAYIADGDYGLQIFNISNPATPTWVGRCDTNMSAVGLCFSGNYAFIADSTSVLPIIDVSTPSQPRYAATCPTTRDTLGVRASGNHIYLANDYSGLQIIDVTNPLAPVGEGQWLLAKGARHVTLSGSYAYVSSDGVYVCDVSDPLKPALTGLFQMPAGADGFIEISGDRVYAEGSPGGLVVLQAQNSNLSFIYGFVKDSAGNTINDVTVTTTPGNYQINTDSKGRYVLSYIPSGTYNITATKTGWVSMSQSVTVADGQTAQAPDIVLPLGTITGNVKDDLGSPVEGATVMRNGIASTTTDANGNYTLANAALGTYSVTASKPGYVLVTNSVTVTSGQTTVSDFTISRTGTIVGTVKENLGNPISGVTVSCGSMSVSTDPVGVYTLKNITPGSRLVVAMKAYWTSVNTFNVAVTPGGITNCDIVLQLGKISGTVKNTRGEGVAGATVSTSTGGYTAMTDSAGSYTLVNVYPGSYTVTASMTGWVSNSTTASVTGGVTTAANLSIKAPGNISGIVKDGSGQPVNGVRLDISCGSFTDTTFSDNSGSYTFTNVLPDSTLFHRVKVSQTGYASAEKFIRVYDNETIAVDFDLQPTVECKIVASCLAGGYGIAIDGQYAYVAASTVGLKVVDISNPLSPSVVATCDTPGDARGVTISGGYAYVADNTSGLQIINISNPRSPYKVGAYASIGSAVAVAVSGTYAYVADTSSGLQIINVSNPAAPTRVGGYNTTGFERGVFAAGSLVYLAAGSAGLNIINVSNPASPVRIGAYDTPGESYDVLVSGNTAFVADDSAGVNVLDVTDPTKPTSIGRCLVDRYCRAMALSGHYLYTAANTSLFVADITSLAAPGLADMNMGGNDVAISGDDIYTVDSYGVMRVLQLSYLEVYGATPVSAANTGICHIGSISGLGFQGGASVKLTKQGQTDLTASNVQVNRPDDLSCNIDLTGASPGFWNLAVTNPDGRSASASNAFGVILPGSAPIVGAVNGTINDTALQLSHGTRRFVFWGKMTKIDSKTFVIDDGSGIPLTVFAPDYWSSYVDGDYVRVSGTLDVLSNPKTLISSTTQIVKLR